MAKYTNKYIPGVVHYPGLDRSEISFRTSDYEGFIRFQNGEFSFHLTEDASDDALSLDFGLPSQAGHSGEYLTTDGTVSSWSSIAHTDLTDLNSTSYYHLTQTQAVDLTDGGASTLHYHASDRARANHTGTQLAATISDFQITVSANTDVTANTAARHSAVTVVDSSNIDLTLTGQQIAADLIDTTVTPGSYTFADITVDAKGRLTAASSNTFSPKARQVLTAGDTVITFSSVLASSPYVLLAYCYDATGDSVDFRITSRTTSGFTITVPIACTLEYRAEVTATSDSTVRKASSAITTGANGVLFSSTIGTTSYVLLVYCYDATGDWVDYRITSRAATGFSITVPVNCTLNYRAEII